MVWCLKSKQKKNAKIGNIKESQFKSNRHPKNHKRIKSGEKHTIPALMDMGTRGAEGAAAPPEMSLEPRLSLEERQNN